MRRILLISFVLAASLLCSLSASGAEAYACYTPSNTTLTFYYDNLRSSRTGTTYDVNTDGGPSGWYEPAWYSDSISESVTRVVFNSTFANARPHTTSRWFYTMHKLQSITGLNYLNTSQVVTMRYMFSECALLTSLDLSGFNTENVEDMDMMFKGCSGLTSLDLSSFNTENVETMCGMFDSCRALEDLDLINFRTVKVKYMREMFADCSGLTTLYVRSFDTSNVKDMRLMFYGCKKLTGLDISSFNTAKVEDMLGMFRNCTKLTTIYAGGGWTTVSEYPSTEMFYGSTKLKGGMGTTYNEHNVSAAYAHIDGGPSYPGYFTDDVYMPKAYACYTPSNTTLTFYYDAYASSRPGTTYNLNIGMNLPEWCEDITCRSSVTCVEFDPSFANARPTTTNNWFHTMENLTTINGLVYLNTSDVTEMSYMFYHCTKLTSINVSCFNTANVSAMHYMFAGCNSISSLDLRSFNTSNVKHMEGMFSGCTNLTSLNLSSFNTAQLDDMHGMFENCSSLTSLDLSSFNTAKVKDMRSMFSSCSSLTSLDLSGFNTQAVENMANMFGGCTNLTSLKLSSFNTANVTSMDYMFHSCISLTSLDLSGFNTTNVKYMYHMFRYCRNLTSIYVGSGWSTATVTDSYEMFYNCTRIVGGMGTTYDANHVDKTYARIDGGPSNPGYLTSLTHPYAVFTSSNNTLTFYYDNQRFSRSGKTYALNVGNTNPGWVSDYSYSAVKRVVFNSSFATARPTSTYGWFYMMDNLQSITGLNYLNTSQVTNMSNMFNRCGQLTAIDVSNFDTHNVTDMSYMFMFCSAVSSLDVSSFNTSQVTNMWGMFNNCAALKTLDLRSFNTSQVTDMMAMFVLCENLKTIYVGSGWSTASVTSSTDMFYMCYNLVGSMGTTYDANHVDKVYAHIDGGSSNPGYLSAPLEAYACYTPSNTTLTFYCDSQRGSRTGTTYDAGSTGSYPAWYLDGTNENVTKVVFDPSFGNARPTSTAAWFMYMPNLGTITGEKYLNTSEVTDMTYMYALTNCLGIELGYLNTSKVKSMYAMFGNCSYVDELDLSSFNTSQVTDMGSMFRGCPNLKTIYVGSDWYTYAVTSSSNMFKDCPNLVGGLGTTYDANHVDKAYAHVDGGPSNPGYLTDSDIEAYACYTSGNGTLTFYYDNQRDSRSGMTYDLNTGSNNPAWHDLNYNVFRIVFDPSFANARPTSTYGWFEHCPIDESITGINYLDTRDVTNMKNMFKECCLRELDLSGFNTAKVADMSGMFYECHSLRSLDLSSFNTSQVTDMSGMFSSCYYMTSLDVRSFNTSNVTNMSGMFFECERLEDLDVSNFNTAKVTDMSWMFSDIGVSVLDLSRFNTKKVGDMSNMFNFESELTTIYVGRDWSTTAVTNSTDMFYGCGSLVGGQGTTYDYNHVDKAYAHIDGGPSNPGYLSDRNEAYACYTSSNTTLTFYYDGQRSSRTGTTYDLNTGANVTDWERDHTNSSVTHVVFDPSFANARPTSTCGWFYGMQKLQTITGMAYLNSSEVTNMDWMFGRCFKLASLDLSNFNTDNVITMESMFNSCGVTSLDFSNCNTANVTVMRQMFFNCSSLTNLNLCRLNTSNVSNMSGMFSNSVALTSLDLGSFNTSKVTNMDYMFDGCTNLTTIYAGDGWTTNAVTASYVMFNGCTNLVGGKGTSYDANHVDKAYAHIDGGPSNPGYFTAVQGYLRGDADGDGVVTIADVTSIIDYLMSGNPSAINTGAADVDFDGVVTIGDITAIIDYLLKGTWSN